MISISPRAREWEPYKRLTLRATMASEFPAKSGGQWQEGGRIVKEKARDLPATAQRAVAKW